MIKQEEVVSLAKLARLALPVTEVEKLCRDLESILGYVASLKVETSRSSVATQVRALVDNSLRFDIAPHRAGIYTERLLAASPETHSGYFVVKPIFTDHGN
ncbi:MAG TPA: aspartyl/glutamyl-tRNA amidotransferase subunit C [Candidatus Paceibacterota bacterium]